MDNTETIKKKILKLQALASSPNPNEALSAAEKIRELLAKYNLDMNTIGIEENKVSSFSRIPEWKILLALAAARLCYCDVVKDWTDEGSRCFTFIGRSCNAYAGGEMYGYFLASVTERTSLYFADKKLNRKKRNDFKYGMARNISTRVRALIQEETADRTDLRETLNKEVALYLKDRPLKKGRKRTAPPNRKFHAVGFQEGDKVSISRQVTTEEKKQIGI